ncbi:mechanosensitive ion channel [Alphaproteobacteria bacterium GH1-50]|uniref:Mechanosensitive ion channel n=1 Tax=Kangsaoukella pontilimi TaxID=2691042 RepID=A0A7C9MI21_9RHOB|nr:mechanosensitive ion channel [Kangsaoukella pontilimi]
MEQELAAISEQVQAFWQTAMLQAELLLLPSRLYQIGILILCIALAWVLTRAIKPRVREWMHTLEGRPKWQLRALLLVNRRLGLIIFTALIWISAAIMSEVTPFVSRRFLLELVGTISLAILLVGFAARLVRNPFLRRIVTWFLWIYVTLYYLGIVEDVSRFLDSLAIEIGDFRLSVLTVITAAIVIGALVTGARLIQSTAASRIRANEDISPSMQVLAVKFLQIMLFGAAFFLGLKIVGVDLTGLAVLSGAIGIGLGFGLQKVVSNLVSGIIILLDKSIKPGDVISIGETFGWINALGARYVSITTRDGREYLIPNEDLITGQVVNWSHSNDFVRLDVYFGTAYGDDPHKVRKLAVEAAASCDRVLATRPPVCHIVGFGDSSVDYILRFWITDPSGGLTNIRGNVFLALWDSFKENGISIPFPQREVKLLDTGKPLPETD